MPYVSRAQVMGHLGRDVESKTMQSGKELHEFSVAVTEKRGAEKVTSWFTVKSWGELPAWKKKELRKGALVMAMGRLSVETWEGRDGKQGTKVVITADAYDGITIFGTRDEQAGGESGQHGDAPAKRQPIDSGISDDDVPF